MAGLLAVDVGLRTGLACFDENGRLVWCRSHNLGSRGRLGRAAAAILREAGDIDRLVLEGGGELARVWEREARRRGIEAEFVAAETWREELLLPREKRSGAQAKRFARDKAAAVVREAGARAPRTLDHDAAEAVLIGVWALSRPGP